MDSLSPLRWDFLASLPVTSPTANPPQPVEDRWPTYTSAAPNPSTIREVGNAESERVEPVVTQASSSNHPPNGGSRRSRYGTLDWEKHKSPIKKLYMDENKSLKDTMEIMKEEHGFEASRKVYKDKINKWGWKKNIPGHYAQWMVRKANQRKKETGKDTLFYYGGLRYDKSRVASSASRSKKADGNADAMIIDTPASITVETPQSQSALIQNSHSPHEIHGRAISPVDLSSEAEDVESDTDSQGTPQPLLVSWGGHSRKDLDAMNSAALSLLRGENSAAAEEMFIDVLEGYAHIVGPTHEDTVNVACALASFYAERDNMDKANKVIENTIGHHIEQYGIGDRRTQSHILHVVELLNSWNREVDALALLRRSKDLQETDKDVTSSKKAPKKTFDFSVGSAKGQQDRLREIADAFRANPDSAKADYGIGVARAHAKANDPAVDAFLLAIIDQCEKQPKDLEIQQLQARSELLKLYKKHNTVGNNFTAFVNARNALLSIWRNYEWDGESESSLRMMEASMELTAALLKAGFTAEANKIFHTIVDKATTLFSEDAERTIWVLISIGLVYQTHRNWQEASSWFEHALAMALIEYNAKDGIVKSLETSLRKRHFSYITDEGKPYKTIFGINGITVRPGRLHLD